MFEQIISELISPTPRAIDGYSSSFQTGTPFDLLTFPEAFAPASTLVSVLQSLEGVASLGCIHVGLRPDDDNQRHLFSNAEIQALVDALRAISATVAVDLAQFSAWFSDQPTHLMINLGCLFTLDAEQRLRVCLHPKLVRSQYEYSPLPEATMAEANLISLVTLLPADKRLLSVTIQPLICSDALSLPTDRGTPPPIVAVNSAETPFDNPPDHIDFVSVATHTPQVMRVVPGKDGGAREWHQEFRETFCRAAQSGELARHHFATFILSNFETLSSGRSGGLSGIFQPIDPREECLHPAVRLSRYGRYNRGNNEWSVPGAASEAGWDTRGYIAALAPSSEMYPAAVRVFGFSLGSTLRDTPLWKPARAPASCEILLARWQTSDRLEFADWRENPDDRG